MRMAATIDIKKALLAFSLLFCLLGTAAAFAAEPDSPLNPMEQQLFARTYPNDSTENRLGRLENTIFGASQSGKPVPSRIASLGQFFKSPQQSSEASASGPIGSKQSPNSQWRAEHYSAPNQAKRPDIVELPNTQTQASSDGTPYPTITAMEQRVFHKTYENESIESRLARLEQKSMGQAQQGTLQERTDQLTMIILGNTGGNLPSDPDPAQDPYNASGSQSASSPNPAVSSADVLRALAPIEKRVLHQTYSQDTIENRLNRLETKLFNATAPEMSQEDRVYRIASVVTAQKSGRGDYAYSGPGGLGTGSGSTSGRNSQAGGAGVTFANILLMLLMSFL